MVTATKERPILFSAPMVRAILDGRKTQTRRVVALGTDFQPSKTPGYDWTFRGTRRGGRWSGSWQDLRDAEVLALCPFGAPGHFLYVRETWRTLRCYDDIKPSDMRSDLPIEYDSDKATVNWPKRQSSPLGVTRPSIHMPRWASRILLEIRGVRVEKLQDITEEDAQAEGFMLLPATRRAVLSRGGQYGGNCWTTARAGFQELWDALNAKRGFGWDANPWVWVVEFRQVEQSVS